MWLRGRKAFTFTYLNSVSEIKTFMDWQLLGLTFVTVFAAEIGDKSQLAAIALGGNSKSPTAVFLGCIAALLTASFLGVMLGGGVAQLLPTRLLKALAAVGFTLLALKLLIFEEAEAD
jgi:putative Ca2+/H+ antiporter (TMEM165/GDT1 family)